METIGKLNSDGTIEKSYYNQGYIYKDFKAYEQKKDVICYVPEFNDDGYTPKDFQLLAETAFKDNNWKGNPQVLADLLFDTVDWQSPETLIDEWHNMSEFDDYPETHGIVKQ